MIRVLVVDDDPVAAETHVAYLSRVEGFESAGSAGTLAEAILRLRADPGIQLVLLDLTLPDRSGVELLEDAQDVVVSIALKPTSSIRIARRSVDAAGRPTTVQTTGRHDPCVGLRATPIAEAFLALVLIDHALRHRAQNADAEARGGAIPAATRAQAGAAGQKLEDPDPLEA